MLPIPYRQSYYNNAQLQDYLRLLDIHQSKLDATLETLDILIRKHLLAFPFESTEIHYTPSRKVTCEPDGVFRRFVKGRKGAGWCFSHNTLMLGMLRAIGYRYVLAVQSSNRAETYYRSAYGCVGQVNQSPDPLGIELNQREHMGILVQVDGREDAYFVDVGYGGGLVHPIRLVHGETVDGIAQPEVHRVTRVVPQEGAPAGGDTHLPTPEDEWRICTNLTREWMRLPEGKWRTLYQFNTSEAHQEEFKTLSDAVSDRRYGLFWENVLVVRYSRPEDETDADLALLVMKGHQVTRREAGRMKVLLEMRTEEDRIMALQEWFGIQWSHDTVKFVDHTAAAFIALAE